MHISNFRDKQNHSSFGNFVRVKGNQKNLKQFSELLKAKNERYLTLYVKKKGAKDSLYIMNGVHFERFVKLMGQIFFKDLKKDIEFYMGSKPRYLSVEKAKEKIFNNCF